MSRIEPKLIQVILYMGNIKWTLTISEGIMLANDLIANTKTQQDLVEWKRKKYIPQSRYTNEHSRMELLSWISSTS